MTTIWALYGVAAPLSPSSKSIAYNCLDVVSKNLYGVVVAAYAWSL